MESVARPSLTKTTTPAAPISWMIRPGFGPRRHLGPGPRAAGGTAGAGGRRRPRKQHTETACAIHISCLKFCVYRQQLVKYAVKETPMTSRAGRREWIGLAVLILPILIASMDVSVLFFAVPFIAQDLQPTATQQLWIFDIYGFVLAGLLLTMGSVGDRIGRRRLLLIGAVAFSAASLLAAYAQTAEMLIAARAVLGIAGATLMPSTLALIRNLFHAEADRTKAVAIWSAALTAG